MNLFSSSTIYITLTFLSEIVMLIYAYRKTNGDLVSPSVVTLGFFVLSFACYLYNTDQWVVVFTLKAFLLYVLSFLIMLSVEFYWRDRNKSRRLKPIRNKTTLFIPEPLDTILFLLFLIFSLIYVYRVYKSGMSLGATSFLMAIGVNKEEGDFDGVSRLLYNLVRIASYVYIVIFCQNVFAARQSIKNNRKSLGIIFITLINTFFSGQRSAMICYMFAFFVALMVAVYDRPRRKFYKRRLRKTTAFAGVFILAIFFLSANIVKGTEKERIFVDYITYYFGCTNGSMGRIIEDPSLCHTPFSGYFGEKTFYGFWNEMYKNNIVSKEPCDRRWIPMHSPATIIATNEYSFFCGPYIDFGFWGTLIFIFVFYNIYAYLYYDKILIRDNIQSKFYICAIYIFLYAMVAMSFYQDTIRTYSRPINLLYIIYMVALYRLCVEVKIIPYKIRLADHVSGKLQ